MERINLNEGSYAFVLAQTALLNCRVAGMQAENAYRFSNGNNPAYGESEFCAVEREFEALIGASAIRNMERAQCSPEMPPPPPPNREPLVERGPDRANARDDTPRIEPDTPWPRSNS